MKKIELLIKNYSRLACYLHWWNFRYLWIASSKITLLYFYFWNLLASPNLHCILKLKPCTFENRYVFQTELYSKQSQIDLLFFYLIGSLDQLQLNSGIQNTGQKSIQKQAHKYLGKKWNFKKLFLSYQQEKRTWFKTWICCARLMQKPWSDLKF